MLRHTLKACSVTYRGFDPPTFRHTKTRGSSRVTYFFRTIVAESWMKWWVHHTLFLSSVWYFFLLFWLFGFSLSWVGWDVVRYIGCFWTLQPVIYRWFLDFVSPAFRSFWTYLYYIRFWLYSIYICDLVRQLLYNFVFAVFVSLSSLELFLVTLS